MKNNVNNPTKISKKESKPYLKMAGIIPAKKPIIST